MWTGRAADIAGEALSKGVLVAIEGIDGAGKTTQARELFASLRAAGISSILTKEPTSGKWGAKIRASAAKGRLPLDEELHAFLEDRKEHVRDELVPALNAGNVVIVDRYYFSTVAYQGARGMDPAQLLELNSFAPIPDLLFVLDIDPNVGLSRVAKRGDVPDLFEREDQLALARRIFTNRALLSKHVADIFVLDATRPQAELAGTISGLVFNRIGQPSSKGTSRGTRDSASEGDGVPPSADEPVT